MIGMALASLAKSLIGPAVGAINAKVADKESDAPEQYRKRVMSDYEAMQSGRLGLTEDEKRKMAQQASDQAGAAITAQEAGMARWGAGGGNPWEGQQAEQMAQVAGQNANAEALAMQQANQYSKQIAEQQKQEILSRMQQAEAREDKRMDKRRAEGKETGEKVGGAGGNFLQAMFQK